MENTLTTAYTKANNNDVLTDILDQLDEGLLWIDMTGNILKGNRSTILKTGFTAKELAAMQIFDFCSGFDNSIWFAHISKLLKGQKVNFKCTAKTKSGKSLPISIKMILTTRDDETCVCIIAKDIAKMKQESASLQRASYEYDKLSYRMSHDIRSPICTIFGLVNLIAKDATEEQKQYLGMIEDTLDKQNQLMTDIHELSSIHTTPIEEDEINIHNLINDIVTQTPTSSGKLNTEWTFNFDLSRPFSNDAFLVHKLLSSIIVNAVQYSRIQNNTSKVSVTASTDDKGVNLEIKDNGFGIDPVIENQVFEMFFRGTQHSKGSGLGLYFAKVISEKLKASIQFVTNTEGTTFTIFIPTCV